MSRQRQHADVFRSLHVPGKPLVIFNVWDAGSAKAVASAGAPAIGLGSWSVAAAQGYEDGERMPLDHVCANLARIVAAVELPVSIDFESGYGDAAAEVGRNIARIIEIGAVGCNLEDGLAPGDALREAADQARRIAAARKAAEAAGIPFFINARSDGFLQAPVDGHDLGLLRHALERGRAYADAGADGLFLPGLIDAALIERAVRESALPINIMKSAQAPSLGQLADLGVARVSHGPGPYRAMMKQLELACRAAMERAGT
jgi:2-methylisocitrate lyase-like PEP mutase family enzyme